MKKTREDLIQVLAAVWRRVNWARICRGRRSAADIFMHRLKVASYQPTFPCLLEKLSHGLGLQSVDVSSSILERLRENEEEALQIVREETIYLTILAKEEARKKEG